MKMMLTLSYAPVTSLELDDLQAVSGGNATVTGDPSKDTTVTRATPSIEEILRREEEEKSRQPPGEKK